MCVCVCVCVCGYLGIYESIFTLPFYYLNI